MNRTWRQLMGLLLAAIIALPVITWADGPASETEADYIQFASSVVELYYRNKDAGENNDLSPFVSEEALKLMDAKCHLSQRKLDLLGLEHNDYQVRIQPIDTEDWYETDTEVYLRLAIVSQWFYSNSTDITTRGDAQQLLLSKNDDGSYTVKECYDLYPDVNYYLGDIDTRYKAALAAGRTDLDALLAEYEETYLQEVLKQQELTQPNSSQSKLPAKNGMPYLLQIADGAANPQTEQLDAIIRQMMDLVVRYALFQGVPASTAAEMLLVILAV